MGQDPSYMRGAKIVELKKTIYLFNFFIENYYTNAVVIAEPFFFCLFYLFNAMKS